MIIQFLQHWKHENTACNQCILIAIIKTKKNCWTMENNICHLFMLTPKLSVDIISFLFLYLASRYRWIKGGDAYFSYDINRIWQQIRQRGRSYDIWHLCLKDTKNDLETRLIIIHMLFLEWNHAIIFFYDFKTIYRFLNSWLQIN